MNLEVMEQKDETKKMLQRVHTNTLVEGDLSNTNELFPPSSSLPVLSQEELYRLLQALESQEAAERQENTSDEDQSIDKVAHVLSSSSVSRQEIQAAINQAIETGELQDWLIEPWHPWWRSELVSQIDSLEEAEEGDNDDELYISNNSTEKIDLTIDERLLSIAPFEKIRPKSWIRGSPPELQFNMIDLLYASTWTLRLYHGVMNAQEVAIPSSTTLLGASAVLSKDARFKSLEDVLTQCVTRSVACQDRQECNAPWHVLVQDVFLIVKGGSRMVGRALLEVADIFRAAEKCTKAANDRKSSSQIKAIRKKVDFYLSWSREPQQPEVLPALAVSIREWELRWRHDQEERVDKDINILLP